MLPSHYKQSNRRLPVVPDSSVRQRLPRSPSSRSSSPISSLCNPSPNCIVQVVVIGLVLFWVLLNVSYLTKAPIIAKSGTGSLTITGDAQTISQLADVQLKAPVVVINGNSQGVKEAKGQNEQKSEIKHPQQQEAQQQKQVPPSTISNVAVVQSNGVPIQLRRSREGVEYIEANATRMHGRIGLKDDWQPGWMTRPYNVNEDMSVILRKGGGFNLELSDSLSLDRDVKESRSEECRAVQYNINDLPPLSVIVVFYNEPFSTLFRSVHSVLNRTPPQLLKEVILVDDGSSLAWIRKDGTGEMENYIKLLPKTRLIRSPERKGIVSARMMGIRDATAPIFAILDSHIEVNTGWAEPISQRIHKERRSVLMPQIDGIDSETFEPKQGGIGCTLGFLWKLIEHGFFPDDRSPPERRNAGPTDFVSSPTMAGGLFAAHRDFFLNDLGGYDEQFQFWGTENLELSFRVWSCGGILECAPCSRVYHIFRKGGVGYSSPVDAVTKNKMRLITVWMDEFADLAWRVIGQPRVDFGEYQTLRKWKEEKKCKPFSAFLKEVNPESDVQELPKDVPYLGPLKNVGTQTCLDTLWNDTPGHAVGLKPCHNGRNQDFMYFSRVQHIMPVANDESCLSAGSNPSANTTDWCWRDQAKYDYNSTTKLLKFISQDKCLAAGEESTHFLSCDPNDLSQQWDWTAYNPPSLFTPPPMPGLRGGGQE